MSLPPSNNKIVLITGINGYIASVIGLELLGKGYTVRGTTRSKHSADALLEGPYAKFRDRVQLVEVGDITKDGAFDEAVRDVTTILHTASPINLSLARWEQVIVPALNGTLSIIASAYSHAGPQFEAFVLTSSLAAINDPSKSPYSFTEADWNDWAEAKAKEEGDAAPGGLLYVAAKTVAEKALWKFRDDKKPPFSISAVNPGVVTGPPVYLPADPTRINLTLQPIWSLFSGTPTIPNTIGSGSYIDVRDVAAMHIWCAEHPTEANGQRYILAKGLAPPQAAADLLRRTYPERKDIPVGEPGTGYQPGYGWLKDGVSFQSAKAEKALGRELIGFEKSILDTVKVFEEYY